jgi:hypothetical protein
VPCEIIEPVARSCSTTDGAFSISMLLQAVALPLSTSVERWPVRPRSQSSVTERLRGEGLLVRKGVREMLLKRERNKFLKEEWPVLRKRLKRLGIDMKTLAES